MSKNNLGMRDIETGEWLAFNAPRLFKRTPYTTDVNQAALLEWAEVSDENPRVVLCRQSKRDIAELEARATQ